MSKILNKKFYQSKDVVQVAKDLIGKRLVSNINGKTVSGIISETEAYCGLTDKACHAFLNKHTQRTKVFYNEGGTAYVYLCYGIHHLFNIITGPKNYPQAVLIRALIPDEGTISTMIKRRSFEKKKSLKNLTDGPGKMTQALGITTHYNNFSLLNKKNIWVENTDLKFETFASKRIGIDYAEEDALLPWRFSIK